MNKPLIFLYNQTFKSFHTYYIFLRFLHFPYNNKRIRELITPERQSYPRPFRTSTSAGALIQGSYNSSNVVSPSSDYSLKSVHHIIGKKQNCSKDVNGYQSLPTITTSNGMERRNKTQSLVVGK